MSADCDRKSLSGKGQSGWWTGVPGEEHIVKLNSSNYDSVISGKPAFIMFFAQWCGYSRSARSALAAAAVQLAKEGNQIMIGAVDCDECKDILKRYPEIRGYPSFLYFTKGTMKKAFRHARTKEAFYSWITAEVEVLDKPAEEQSTSKQAA